MSRTPLVSATTEAESRQFMQTVREEIARRRISRDQLAVQARISLSTLDKALSGERPLTLATRIRLEDALGLSMDTEGAAPTVTSAPAIAPSDLGAYSQQAADWLAGEYVTLRPSFDTEGAIYAYRTRIEWHNERAQFVFSEHDRLFGAYAQRGCVSIPSRSGFLYLYTNEQGQMRLAIFNRPAITGELYGVMAGLRSVAGGNLSPVATHIALVPIASFGTPAFGVFSPSNEAHGMYAPYLEKLAAGNLVDMLGF